MLTLDHLTVIAPTLAEGVAHVRTCLDLDVPFGTRHFYMGTHNHRLQLGGRVYLEIVACDPDGIDPGRTRWFGLDDQAQVQADWEAGRRLRGWVTATTAMEDYVTTHPALGEVVVLPPEMSEFAFAIPRDGSLPMDGVLPSLIDHRNDPTDMAGIPNLDARLESFVLMHPEPALVATLYRDLEIDRPPTVELGDGPRFHAVIETPSGQRLLS
jgi:hypothetical protein